MRSLVLVCLVACGSSSDPAPDHATTFGGDRPATLGTPSGFDDATSYPLLMVLHGYGANGFVQSAFFGVSGLPSAGEAFVIAPDGQTDSTGKQYWNADPICCDLDHTGVDDSAYLGTMLDDILTSWPEIDPARVYVLGHSNGGFMSYRLACDHADTIAAIGVLAGDAATTVCEPSQTVNVLHMHGTADDTVPYSGAEPSVAKWAGYNGCGATRHTTSSADFIATVAGDETSIEVEDGCPANSDVELWSMAGGGHVPSLTPTFEPALWAWFGAHHR